MASIRHHARVDRSADDIWAVISQPGDITWMPGVDASSIEGDVRSVSTMGMEIKEQIITNDGSLRRLQYSIVDGPMIPDHHVATIDVIEDGDGSIVVYSCDIKPDESAAIFDNVYKSGTEAIKAHFES